MFTGVTTQVKMMLALKECLSFLSRDSSNTTSKYNPTIKLIGIIKMHVDRVVASSSKLIIT